MFYSAHDHVLPIQLVGIGLIMLKTKQPRSKLAAKLCSPCKLSWLCTQVLQVLFAFFSPCCHLPLPRRCWMGKLSCLQFLVAAVPWTTQHQNQSMLSPLRGICFGQEEDPLPIHIQHFQNQHKRNIINKQTNKNIERKINARSTGSGKKWVKAFPCMFTSRDLRICSNRCWVFSGAATSTHFYDF